MVIRLKNKLDSLFFTNEFIRFVNIVPAQGIKVKYLKVCRLRERHGYLCDVSLTVSKDIKVFMIKQNKKGRRICGLF